ncbi:hypothetical protein CSKR_100654 [Clonorchis sinensis]|uniref:Uncharacterized protein n=1 Tax=Clonorchis sinensis TaxID=79923 RepID=A0A419PG07_CLOSI|nr:hypothetical protein CSKR_100654 [Clonorchis sinensis]
MVQPAFMPPEGGMSECVNKKTGSMINSLFSLLPLAVCSKEGDLADGTTRRPMGHKIISRLYPNQKKAVVGVRVAYIFWGESFHTSSNSQQEAVSQIYIHWSTSYEGLCECHTYTPKCSPMGNESTQAVTPLMSDNSSRLIRVSNFYVRPGVFTEHLHRQDTASPSQPIETTLDRSRPWCMSSTLSAFD